ncbi:peptidoglycan-binding protein [Streptomyces sp. NPDC002446]
MTALRTCPHCFAPVRSDGRPTCLCAAADAEDFDPLRIRPYVSLPDDEEDAGEAAGEDENENENDWKAAPAAFPSPSPSPSAFAAASEPLIPPVRRRLGPTSRTVSSAPEEPAAAPSGRSAAASAPSRRKRALPAVLAAAGAAAAATAVLIGTDALSGGTRDRAAPPDGGPASPTATLPTSEEPAPTHSDAPSSPAAATSPSPGATGTGVPRATVTLRRTASPSPPAPTRASGSVTDSPVDHHPSTAPNGPIVLREGASGPEVTELQGRLRQLALYPGAEDGRYDADVRSAVSRYQQAYGVAGDPDGVYGTRTRASLESRTQEP